MPRYKKSKDGYYRTTVWDGTYVNGTKHRRTISAKTMDGLTKAVDRFRLSLQTGDAAARSDMPFYDYAKNWCELAKSGRSPRTYEMYESSIRKMKPLNIPVSDINYSTIQHFLKEYSDRPRTQEILLMTLKQIVRSAEKDRLLPRSASLDIFSDISTTKYKAPEKRPLTDIEKEYIFKADFTDRERLFVLTIYGTGIRRQEALALTKSDILDGELSINKAVTFAGGRSILKEVKTDNGLRTIPLQDSLYRELCEYAGNLKTEYLFTKLDGDMMTKSSYNKMWKSIRRKMKDAYIKDHKKDINWKKAGITDLTAHIFRHNYCTALCYEAVKGNISTKKIAKLLGDTEKMVMEVYSHIIEEQENTISAIENAVNFVF